MHILLILAHLCLHSLLESSTKCPELAAGVAQNSKYVQTFLLLYLNVHICKYFCYMQIIYIQMIYFVVVQNVWFQLVIFHHVIFNLSFKIFGFQAICLFTKFIYY